LTGWAGPPNLNLNLKVRVNFMRGGNWNGWLLGGVLAIAAGGACAAFTPIAPPLSQADADRLTARGQAVTLGELEEGRSLFVGRCAACHRLPRPDAYGTDRWPVFVDEMAARAQLTPPQAGAVLRYLLAARQASAQDR
jgi:mono/diheme cytochrome c family protein